ncbi:MAG: hypothetical protein C0602_08035 [Denitrovibrio sp.]|nr:MAG: hypothetical protein C0602_08035 [Denitrovibrio sp.]
MSEHYNPFCNDDILDDIVEITDTDVDEDADCQILRERYYSEEIEEENFTASANSLEAVINRFINTSQNIQTAIKQKTLGETTQVVEDFKKEIFKLVCRKETKNMVKSELDEEYFELPVFEVIDYVAEWRGPSLYTDGIELSYYLLANLYINRITHHVAQQIHLLYCSSRITASSSSSRNPANQRLKLAIDVFVKDNKKLSTDISSVLDRFSSRLFGYENIKDYLDAALSLYINSNNPVFEPLLLIGPPGVGKTCVAEALSYALELELINIPLTASPNDAVRLTGTAEQWNQSKEGLIINKYKQLKYSNCVMLLDEIDKTPVLTQDIVSNLTDPKANFEDAFFTAPINFTKHAFFVLTANSADLVPDYLKNRCKVLYIDDYTSEEKNKIARDYLLPQLQSELDINTAINISDATIAEISNNMSLREIKRLLKDALCKALNRKKRRKVTIEIGHAKAFMTKVNRKEEKVIGF